MVLLSIDLYKTEIIMKIVHLIYIEPKLVDSFKSIKPKCKTFAMGEIFRERLNEESDVSKMVKEDMDKGIIPSMGLIIEMIRIQIDKIENQNFGLLNFPRNYEQFKHIEMLLLQYDYKIEKIFWFRHNDLKRNFEKYYLEPQNELWFNKYGGDIEEAWYENLNKFSKSLEILNDETKNYHWEIINIDYNNQDDSISTINKCLNS
jgi:adenylate kinase family enzyme